MPCIWRCTSLAWGRSFTQTLMSTVFDPMRLSAISMDLMAVSRGTVPGIAQRQQARLAQLITSTLRDSRLYQAFWPKGTTGNTPLHQLPFVTRKQLMDDFDDWVTDPRIHLKALRAFTAQPEGIGQPWLGQYIVWESSGTSGLPGVFIQDVQTMAVYDALEALRRSTPARGFNWLDPLGLTERTAFIGALDGHFASYASVRRLCAINPWLANTTRSFSILDPAPQLVKALNAFAPKVIATYATAATLLADEAKRGNLHIAPREIWTGGEPLGVAARAHIQQHLGCAVRNSYGASEFLAMGWECDHGHMHLNADWVILEPVDEYYRPVPAGQPSCSVLLTNLANTVQPLIRYDLGDQVTLHDQRCTCGSPLPVIEIQGRHDDLLVMAGRDGRPVTLLPLALSTVLEDYAGVFDFYLHQIDDRTLELHLPLDGHDGQLALVRCCAALKAFAETQGIVPIEVRGILGQSIPRGRSGKACHIVASGHGGQCAP